MNKSADRFTRVVIAAINILFIGYPIRTSLGALVGIVIKTIVELFKPLFNQLSSIIDVSQIAGWEYVILGIVLLHLPNLKFYLSEKASRLGDNEEKALEIIRTAKQRGVPEARIAKMYIELCEKVLEKVELNQATKDEINNLTQG